jgi:hypothetical protein
MNSFKIILNIFPTILFNKRTIKNPNKINLNILQIQSNNTTHNTTTVIMINKTAILVLIKIKIKAIKNIINKILMLI